MNKLEQYKIALLSTSRIKGINKYNQIFLATMILRGIRHPEEGLTEIVQKSSDTMEKRYSNHPLEIEDDEKMRQASIKALKQTEESYGKTNVLKASLGRSFDGLERALERASFPVGFEFSGEQTVKSVFDYLMKNVKKVFEIVTIKGLSDDEIVFITDMYEEKVQNPEDNLQEIAKKVMQRNGEACIQAETKIEDVEIALISSKIPTEWQISTKSKLEGVLEHLMEKTSEK